MSDGELKTLALLVDAAEAGRPAPTADDIQEHTGCNSISSTVGFVQKLEKRGLISVERFQRSRRITILATGKRTAAVANQTPHWRSGPPARHAPRCRFPMSGRASPIWRVRSSLRRGRKG